MSKIEFGPLSAPLREQIPGLVASEWYQKKADAISLLTIHGLLTKQESDRARRRLIKTFRIHPPSSADERFTRVAK